MADTICATCGKSLDDSVRFMAVNKGVICIDCARAIKTTDIDTLRADLAAMTERAERAERERDRLALELVCRQCVNGLRGRGCLSKECMFPNVAGKVAKWVAYAEAELKGADHA